MYLVFDFFDQDVVVHVDSNSLYNFYAGHLVNFFDNGDYRPRPWDFVFCCAIPDSQVLPENAFTVPVLYLKDGSLFYA